MKLGAYTACLHDRPIAEALGVLRGLGLDSAEINSGGFLPAPHLPIAQVRSSKDARDEYLGLFTASGITLTALNCNGNPLHPDPEVGQKHAQDVRDAISLAALLGVKRVVTMSGLPAAHAGGRAPSWTVLPWDSVYLDARDYQWNATHVGAEMDPSHLFWQGIDPVAALERLGGLVYNAAAKDTRINAAASINGVLDDRFGRVAPQDPGAVSLGGRYTLSRWPQDSSWDFVAVGRGHDLAFWSRFLQALQNIDAEMAVNVEHEDRELDQLEGLRFAATTLLEAASTLRATAAV
jgi:sugar phosphate isomerase/epimerase